MDERTPFYSSTTPQIFAIAVATVVSYLLVILIFITPRTFFVGGPGGGAGFLTRRGLSGNSSVIGVGRRPLLQKIAAITVAISMTIATADTFNVTKQQYEEGFMDSHAMVRQVVGGLEIRVIQVISNTFLWLAQVQTLIRLFPRHKEKVTIKWLGFALILLGVIFSTLNNFFIPGTTTRPRNSRDAIPALSYLFELAIGFIYASCVIYYSISKYRFAFYHAKMRNICLVALLSITSVLIPVVFFVIDVSSPNIATWGFYIRWVGGAAASVVVWEWVERIEALERDERKDGILGREVYDGDEMLDVTTSNAVNWPGRRSRRNSNGSSSSRSRSTPGLKDRLGSTNRRIRSRMSFYKRKRHNVNPAANAAMTATTKSVTQKHMLNPAQPAAIATPVSRADTASAASIVYAVRYHNEQISPQHLEDAPHGTVMPKVTSKGFTSTSDNITVEKDHDGQIGLENLTMPVVSRDQPVPCPRWTAVNNLLKRKRALPPAEVAGAQMLEASSDRRSPATIVKPENWNLRSRMDTFKTTQRDKLRARRQVGNLDDSLPVTIIPAQPRGTSNWSPDDLVVASDRVRHDQAPSHDENTPQNGKSPRNGEQLSVTFLPSAIPGRRTWSSDNRNATQEQPSAHGLDDSALRRPYERLHGEQAPTGDWFPGDDRSPLPSQKPSKTFETAADGVHEPNSSIVEAMSTTDSFSQPQGRRLDCDLNTGRIYTLVATSQRPEAPVYSSSVEPHLSPTGRSSESVDSQRAFSTDPDAVSEATVRQTDISRQ